MNLREARRTSPAQPLPKLEEPAFPRIVNGRQPLGLGERLFTALHRFTATNVTRVMALDGVIATRDLKNALRNLQTRHPLMRAAIVEGASPYFLFDQRAPLPLRLVRRRDDEHVRELLDEILNRRMAYSPGPLFEVYYLSSERSRRSELILVGEHAVCDGVSMNNLAAELLELCARAQPRPPRRRTKLLDELLPDASAGEMARGFGAALLKFARVAVQRMLHERRRPSMTSAHEFAVLARSETELLTQRARSEKTTITGALMAGVMLAVRERTAATPRLALSVPVNLRPRLPGGEVSAEDLGNYTGAVYLETRATDEFWQLARTLKRDLDEAVQGEQLLAAAPLVYQAGRLLVRPGRPALAHAMVSSSGVVPIKPDYGSFKVSGFYSATSAALVSADLCFFCNTFDECLHLNVVFLTEAVPRLSAAFVLQRVGSLLAAACSV